MSGTLCRSYMYKGEDNSVSFCFTMYVKHFVTMQRFIFSTLNFRTPYHCVHCVFTRHCRFPFNGYTLQVAN